MSAGCGGTFPGPDAEATEQAIEEWLGVDIPREFEAYGGEHSFTTGDFFYRSEIRMPRPAFARFLGELSIDHADTLRAGRQIRITRDLESGGYDFFSIYARPSDTDSTKVELQVFWGNE